MLYLRYLCLLENSGVQHILCCVFVLFVFILSTQYCQILWIVHCFPSVFSNVYLNGVYSHERFENNKRVIDSRKPMKDKQYNGQKKMDKRTNNDLQSLTQKTKDRASRTPIET